MQTNPTAVLIAPDEVHRRLLTRALESQHAHVMSVLNAYPAYNHLVAVAEMDCDAFLIEVDTDTDNAMDVVEAICSRNPSATVMLYSQSHQADLLLAGMRAGAREYLSGVIPPNVLSDALLRAAARRAETSTKKQKGKLLMFWGAKGGSGTTTLATNFSIALHRETGGEVALVDLHPQLGDVGVLLGVTPRFTITDALMNPSRLDEDFVSTLVSEHKSGISVLAAPDSYTSSVATEERTVGKLLELVSNRFPYAVIDAGPSLGAAAESLFQLAGTVYLVTQVDIPSLRNCQRFISHLQRTGDVQIELVLNRYEARKVEFDDERLAKAVGVAPKWRVPNDYAAVRRAANTGIPVLEEKSAVAGVMYQMARAACGKIPENEKKKGFRLFGS
jgi:pilus assembly protein CpaE